MKKFKLTKFGVFKDTSDNIRDLVSIIKINNLGENSNIEEIFEISTKEDKKWISVPFKDLLN